VATLSQTLHWIQIKVNYCKFLYQCETTFPHSYVSEIIDEGKLSIYLICMLLVKMLNTVLEIISNSNYIQINYWCLYECIRLCLRTFLVVIIGSWELLLASSECSPEMLLTSLKYREHPLMYTYGCFILSDTFLDGSSTNVQIICTLCVINIVTYIKTFHIKCYSFL
jgi:hypothetical protein